MRARAGGRRSGFTLIELVTYLALVTSAGVVIGGLEMAASRAAFLERALVEIAFRGDLLGTHFRGDVREASHASVLPLSPMARGAFLILLESNGEENRYVIEQADKLDMHTENGKTVLHAEKVRLVREFRFAPGREVSVREITADIEKLDFLRESAGTKTHYTLSLTLGYGRRDEITARRSFTFSATPVAEESP